MSVEQQLANAIAVMRQHWMPGAELCGDDGWLYLRLPNGARCHLLLVGTETLPLVEALLVEQRVLRLAEPAFRELQLPAERRRQLTFEDVYARRSA